MLPHQTENLHGNRGRLEVICGSMFSGKTEELIRRMRRAQFARQKVEIFKPIIDTRYSDDQVVSHDRNAIPSTPIPHSSQLLLLTSEVDVIGIDEAQFFDRSLVEVCNRLADDGRRVIVAGLDQDFQGRPFEPIPELLAVAEYITKNLAVCMVCGAPADRSQRLDPSEAQVLLGATDLYEARCRRHWQPLLHRPEQPDLPL